ncbi:MAG: indole-3-glycerol phosphate synthase TrpC [Anaerolineales bacterium]
MNILQEIFTYKQQVLAQRKHERPLKAVVATAQAAPPPLDLVGALLGKGGSAPQSAFPALIAEVKRGSPSRGLLARDFDPLHLARLYVDNGAAAISVLTDERYFGGHLDYLAQIAGLTPRPPLLRKDFICDPYQVYEARAAGADAILLIVAGLSAPQLAELHALTKTLGMAALVEVHTRQELEQALALKPALVGINNRDLSDFSVNLETTLGLLPHVPKGVVVVSESGIRDRQDVERLAAAGVQAVLVGEALVAAEDTAARVRELSGVAQGVEP